MIIRAQSYGLHPRDAETVVKELQKGKVGIVPTDSVYAFCCLSDQKQAFEQICKLKKIDPRTALMSIVCKDLSSASEYFVQWTTPSYRILHKNLPGPFTFILESGHRAPAFLKNKRKTLGLRIPEHQVIKSIMDRLEMPLLVSSVRSNEAIEGFYLEREELIDRFEKQVGFIIVDDIALQEESTVVDMTGDEPEILRQSQFQLRL